MKETKPRLMARITLIPFATKIGGLLQCVAPSDTAIEDLERRGLSLTTGSDGNQIFMCANQTTAQLHAQLLALFPTPFRHIAHATAHGDRQWALLYRAQSKLQEAVTRSPTGADFIAKSCKPGKGRPQSHLFIGSCIIINESTYRNWSQLVRAPAAPSLRRTRSPDFDAVDSPPATRRRLISYKHNSLFDDDNDNDDDDEITYISTTRASPLPHSSPAGARFNNATASIAPTALSIRGACPVLLSPWA
ncbi:hypothetical protein BOTBODRAFT_176712 [Botryobasidium botryosum FD-172 SS1]|uniref:Uncharacterized protein n=1 Tax=Botryobasidium botryosum (strain FD-172 SS1) TaxID=930990 RepID=A0A067MBX0_BOTB1|nr:hypothetical protein BOTBODRAFT_176712 [Botryobasidium botryosum FD-172 SS1]